MIQDKIKLWIKRHTPIHEWIKFKIAAYLDGKYTDACWCNLCLWVVGYRSFRDTFLDGSWKSQTCSEDDWAYCGKCLKTGRLSK